MSHNEARQTNTGKYAALQKQIIETNVFKPVRVILPIAVIIFIIAVMCIYTFQQRKNIAENAEQVTNQMAKYVADSIANEINYAKSSIRFVSLSVSQTMSQDILEQPSEVILPMVESSPFGGIEYIRPDGMNVMNIGEPFDASDRVYYVEGMKGNTGIWNNYHPKTSRETLMNFYTPLMYQGKISGVITGYIAASTQLAPLLETKLYGQDMYGILVDENGMVICSTTGGEFRPDLSLDVLMDDFAISREQKDKLSAVLDKASGKAVSYKNPEGQGRVCVTKIPGTEWKVAIVVPETSFNAIIEKNTTDSVIAIVLIGLVLIVYAAYVLLKNVKRRKDIAIENARLEEENRSINEENERAFNEIAAIRDINASAHMGTWRIELVEGEEPRMYVDETMKALLGVEGKNRTPEETYKDWFENIVPEAVPSVLDSVAKMEQGKFDENTYLWLHHTKGERYVRCGGTAQTIPGGYLLSGYHYDVDEVVREDMAQVERLNEALNQKNDFYTTLGSLAGIYNSLHVIDLVEDTVVEYSARDEVKNIVNHREGAVGMMQQVMTALTAEESREKALDFTNLTTLADRMKGKKYITSQLISKHIGWFLASFIAMETDEEGKPTKVICTTRSIDEEKKQEESLIYKSQTDELTGLLNRRAFEEDIYACEGVPKEDNFVFMSLDVNGLKVINDSLGHAAGDELLIGSSYCMKRALGPYGKLFRTGGDEFIAILFCDHKKLEEILADFEEVMNGWSGEQIDGLSISYGWVSKEEKPELSVRELGIIADQRMYEAKTAHYRKVGIDRKGQQEAHKALCALYTKILKINITDDTYQIVNLDAEEQTSEMGFADKISQWLGDFGKTGQVHPEDLQEYFAKTDIGFMREYFAEDKTSLSIFYRRKMGEEFKLVMMEIIPAADYSPSNQSLYLYVKNIDK